jgi:hypothetical protein
MNRATLLPAVKEGKVSMGVIDDKVRRLLSLLEGWRCTTRSNSSVPLA